jgi:hypothetical protein
MPSGSSSFQRWTFHEGDAPIIAKRSTSDLLNFHDDLFGQKKIS